MVSYKGNQPQLQLLKWLKPLSTNFKSGNLPENNYFLRPVQYKNQSFKGLNEQHENRLKAISKTEMNVYKLYNYRTEE